MNKQQLAAKIWESANRMRSKIEANEYKDYILGFIFYKFLSETEVRWCKSHDFEEEDIRALSEEDDETVDYIRENIGYFIGYESLFSTWLTEDFVDSARKFTVDDVRVSISAFNRNINPAHKKVFEGIFETLETGLSKLGENSAAQTKAIRDLLDTIKDIPMDGRQDYDVLGFIYEYLISNFAANAGKKAGEFYTPHEVSQLMSEIVAEHCKGKHEISIYDPTSGSGSLLINIGKAVAKRLGSSGGIKYFAQELKENTYNLTRMNLIMRGILPSNIATRNGDTLEDDWPYFDESDPAGTYNPLYVDAVVSNPPYSQRWDPTDKDVDPRYAYGLAPKSKADYAFLLHDLYHLRPEGIMCIVLPHGVLFRGGEEGQIRRNLIENRHIQAIIGLPANIFFGTGIPTIIMVLRQKREDSDVLIVDASKGFEKVGKNNRLRACDIKRISDVVSRRESVEGFSRVVSLDEIRSNDYNLNIPRYVDSSDPVESWDIYASMFGGVPSAELDAFQAYWDAWPSLRKSLFSGDGAYVEPAVANMREVIESNPDVMNYRESFDSCVEPVIAWLDDALIGDPCAVDAASMEQAIADVLFDALGDVALIDPYSAYQSLDDVWSKVISLDLEVLRSEGISAATKVDPRMVLKKKNNKDVEVQDGWQGRVIPFELIEETLLSAQADELRRLEERLSACMSDIEQSAEELTEEEREILSDALDDDNASWKAADVKKLAKSLAAEVKTDAELEDCVATLRRVQGLFDEQKRLKAAIKAAKAELHASCKETIEGLDEGEVKELLSRKWVAPFANALRRMPDALVDDLVSKVGALCSKYETTLKDLSEQIEASEKELFIMIDDLTGDEFDLAGLNEFKKLLGGE